MPVIKPEDLRQAVPKGQRLLGLDLGSKIIGVALSDTTWRVASPLANVRRRKFGQVFDDLVTLIDKHDIGGLVIGLPVNMDGSEGPRCQATRAFAANVLQRRDLPICFQDERLSTAAVERMLVSEMDTSRGRRRDVVDKLAATYILQTLLERISDQHD